MTRLPNSLSTWSLPDFEDILKKELAGLSKELPLQEGLTFGSFALEEPLDVMLISASESRDAIETKVGIFYKSRTPGCACSDDPMIDNENAEYITVLICIHKHTAEAIFRLLEDY